MECMFYDASSYLGRQCCGFFAVPYPDENDRRKYVEKNSRQPEDKPPRIGARPVDTLQNYGRGITWFM